jgi:DNA-binding NarL/FixJ family response regulator
LTGYQISMLRKSGCFRAGRPVRPEEVPPYVKRTLELLCRGWSNPEIAVEIDRSKGCVTRHVTALLVVYGARDRTHLAALAAAQGHVTP